MSEHSHAPHESETEAKARVLKERMQMGFNMIPFNQVIGLQITDISLERVSAQFAMKPQLIGNMTHQILHGGVIATALDTIGGAMAMSAVYAALKGISREERMMRILKLATLDMRVDYLKPGRGQMFTVSSTVLRVGKKVCVTRMELENEDKELIAVGTATYMY
ncbi:MAG TPA: thioesterase family protein [Fluviicoccus sp.]|nr:thioesterase family protein [Fluviicoccus sp.]